MSNQCRSCSRDLNNNYIPYPNAYATANNSNGDRESSMSPASSYNTRSSVTTSSRGGGSSSMGKLSQIANAASQSASAMSSTSAVTQTQLTAKVMFGTVGAIKELREKEKSRHSAARATDRRN